MRSRSRSFRSRLRFLQCHRLPFGTSVCLKVWDWVFVVGCGWGVEELRELGVREMD